MAKADKRPIIIKKIKKAGHAHHGGSWKVAYADFVTAMMAFFMVMWILGMDEQTRKAIEGYFSNPAGFKKGYGSGSSPLASGSSPAKLKDNAVKLIVQRAEEKQFTEAAERIKSRIDSARGALGSAKFEVAVSASGLRIELIEDAQGENFFPRGSAEVKSAARIGLGLIASELRSLHSPVVVEGHTDAARYDRGASYTNWELSADRANAARRVLEGAGLDPRRVVEVRGYADTRLRNPDDPLAAQNRRISILLQFTAQRITEAQQPPPRS
jgi:chemotaxis protein MotB